MPGLKGQIIVRDFMVFLSELAILLLSVYFILTAGAEMGEFVFNFDSRLASETIFGFEVAAEMSGGDFEASFTIPPNPYSLTIGDDDGNYFVFIESSRELFRAPGATTISFQDPKKLFFIHTEGNNIIPLDGKIDAPVGGKMSERDNWKVSVKKIDNDIGFSVDQLNPG